MNDGRARKEALRECYAAEVLLVEDEPEDDDVEDDDFESDDVEDAAFESEEDDDGFDDAGLLLDDEPRLSLR